MKYGQVYDGERIEPKTMLGHKMKCCDCGLVHIIDFYIVGKKVQFVSRRDKRATAAARREMAKAKRISRTGT